MTGGTLDDKHLDALREVVDASRLAAPSLPLPWEVLHGVGRLIGCDGTTFIGIDYGARSFSFSQSSSDGCDEFEQGEDPLDAVFWHHFPTSPCAPPWVPERVPSVTKPTDFMTDSAWRNLPIYVDCFRQGRNTSYELMMSVPDGAGRQLRLLCWRYSGRDFTEAERFDLQLLLPHLEATYRRGERQRGTPEITARQRELLEFVADGYTNRQIGQRMHLSEGTVRTHLNNIYARLGVASRTEAVTRVLAGRGAGVGGAASRE
jgi:DNA-binding CsgD family transcriptional regulator